MLDLTVKLAQLPTCAEHLKLDVSVPLIVLVTTILPH
jgi:hypothetical protein